MWFDSASPLRSGWAWGQNYLEGGTTAFEATVGQGKVYAFGPEITFRAQPHGTFKFLMNGIHPVGRRDDAHHEARIHRRRRPPGDRPQGVPGTHDVRASGACVRAAADTDGVGYRSGEDPDDPDGDRERDQAAAPNACSTHAPIVSERVFDVKARTEHMFAYPPGGC